MPVASNFVRRYMCSSAGYRAVNPAPTLLLQRLPSAYLCNTRGVIDRVGLEWMKKYMRALPMQNDGDTLHREYRHPRLSPGFIHLQHWLYRVWPE